MAEPVSLQEITKQSLRAVLALEVADAQKGFVAPNAVSLAQALFEPRAWYRAICMHETPVGFVMLDDPLNAPAEPGPPADPQIWVWRLMVDRRHQGQGIGRAAMGLVVAHARSRRAFSRLLLSYVPGPGSPEPFYRGLGFQPTGEVEDGEIVMQLPLRPGHAG